MNIGQVLNIYKAHLDATITKQRGLIAINKLKQLNKYEVRAVSVHIQDYIDSRKVSAGTINRELGVLQSALLV